jgi:hypothetical protein
MSISSRHAFLFVLGSIAIATGCTTTTSGSVVDPKETTKGEIEKGGKGTSVDVCERLCARSATCDPSTDADVCESTCDNVNSTYLAKIRDEVKSELASCIDKAACRDLESGSAISSCRDEAKAKVSTTDEATSFCDDYAAALNKCGTKLDKADCYDDAKVYSDATLAAAGKCFGKKCSDLTACVTAAFGGTSSSPSPEPTPDPEPAPDGGTCSGPKMPWTDSACASCMGAFCCEEDNACANDSSCMAYLGCIQSCTTPSCEAACDSSYPTGATLLSKLGSCLQSSCPVSCG